MESVTPDWHPMGSITVLVTGSEEEARRIAEEAA
jgi:hypothetical protein